MALDCTVTAERADNLLTVTLIAENTGSEPVELTFPSGQTVEVVVERDGEAVWRYGADRMFTQALRFETVEPGEKLTESVTWAGPPDGELDVRAWLPANGVDRAATTSVTD